MKNKKQIYLDMLKKEISKAKTSQEFNMILENWRYEKFPCFRKDGCRRKKFTCEECYENWLNSPIEKN